MAGTTVRRRLSWQLATVAAVTEETDSVRTVALDLPDWPGHRAGQHLDVRLTAEDGYSAERSYSIASADGEPVAITVERLDNGEVSPYLTQELRPGDQMEVRGPIGNWFTWGPHDGGPLLLIAGGSGVVPLRAILRHRQRSGSSVPARLLYSSRSLADVIYREELDHYRGSAEVRYTLTRNQPPGWGGFSGRVDDAMLARVAWPASRRPLAFICGPTPFVEAVAELVSRATTRPAGVGPIAETTVYLRGPGTVVRCSSCTSVLMVVARIRGLNCVDLSGVAALEANPAVRRRRRRHGRM